MIGWSWTDVSVLGSQVFGQALMDSCVDLWQFSVLFIYSLSCRTRSIQMPDLLSSVHITPSATVSFAMCVLSVICHVCPVCHYVQQPVICHVCPVCYLPCVSCVSLCSAAWYLPCVSCVSLCSAACYLPCVSCVSICSAACYLLDWQT